MLYSFDLFDTLITRKTASPRGIFAFMQEELWSKYEKGTWDDYLLRNFYQLRYQSEKLARDSNHNQGIEEITLDDIYRAMALCGCLDEAQIRELCLLEQRIELDNVVGIAENIERVKKLYQNGERVILISDMYLSKDAIHNMLRKADPMLGELPLYVSSEYGLRKTTGNLYRKVHELEDIEYHDWLHVGDNVYQDIKVPAGLGIHTEQAAGRKLTEFEKEVLEKYGSDSRIQLMIGTAELANKESDSIPYYVGCRYAGTLLYSYAEWIVDVSVKKGIRRLYFIARDGYLLHKIVGTIIRDRGYEISLHYIYGSRRAWRMPSLSEEYYNLYQLMLWSHRARIDTLEELANVLMINVENLYKYLPGVYVYNRSKHSICGQELEYIIRKLEENPEFRKTHLQALAERRQLTQEYLRQEIDVSDDMFAFVDVSGSGLTQGCLRELMRDWYQPPIHTFFFRIDRVRLVRDSIAYVFLPSVLEHKIIIEMLCRAPHGQTNGYQKKNGKVEPVLSCNENMALIEHGFYEYEQGIMSFTRMMSQETLTSDCIVNSFRTTTLYLEAISKSPEKPVLDFFASMPSNESGRGQELIEYAPKLTDQEIKDIFLYRTYEPLAYFYKGTDLDYSLLRASEGQRQEIERYKKEHDAELGKAYRRTKEDAEEKLRQLYGRAAFYPVRALERKIVIYGAGKFGQDLYHRIVTDEEHEVVAWVDKDVDGCLQRGLKNVLSVQTIFGVEYDQIVVAVMSEAVSEEITQDLVKAGIDGSKIVWFYPYPFSNSRGQWNRKGIG